jgi:CubicO group peptidase (beta-lactamase class C family)
MRRRLAALLLALCVLAAACGGDDEAPEATSAPEDEADVEASEGDGDDLDGVEAVLAELAEDEPGCAAAIGEAGEVVWTGAAGLADVESGTPIDDGTVFDIGSTSKQFTATAILLLAAEGRVDLADPVRRYLPSMPPWAEQTTLRQLVQHTSGIPDYIGLLVDEGYAFEDRTTDADALAAIESVEELEFEPGTGYAYSNSGYFLLGQVVLAVTGQSLGDFLAAEVFEPLGLDALMDPVAEIPAKATSYEWDGDEEDYVVADSGWEQTGDGGIQTTPSELVRWAPELHAPTVVGEEALVAARLEDVAETDEGDAYGGGIIVTTGDDGETVLMHSGSWAGFLTDLVVLPDSELAAAVSCNRSDTDPTSMAFDLLAAWQEG